MLRALTSAFVSRVLRAASEWTSHEAHADAAYSHTAMARR
jgi:hypothetical protein